MAGMKHPPETWKWYGRPGHFCGSADCRFHLTTQVGPYLVSTVGDYRLPGECTRTNLGPNPEDDYETMVFRVSGTCECGCGRPDHNGQELKANWHTSALSAEAGHYALCLECTNL